MIFQGRAPIGAVAPRALVATFSPPNGYVGTQVSSAIFYARAPGAYGAPGQVYTWNAVVSGQTSTAFTLTHSYSSGDLNALGTWKVYAKLYMNDGTDWDTTSMDLTVYDPFMNPPNLVDP